MTREHKLALIVGFGLLLLVGVLISDHLSRAREVRIDSVALEPAAVVQAQPKSIPIDPLQPVNRSFANAEEQVAVPQQMIKEPTATTPAESAPLRLADASLPSTPSSTRLPDAVPSLGGDGSLESAILKNGGSITPGTDGVRQFTIGDASKPVSPPQGNSAPAKPAAASGSPTPDRMHVVKKNETLFALAKSYYGDGKYWTAIAEHNKDKVGKNGSLREGQSLRIPSRMAVTGKPDPAPVKTVSPPPSKLTEGIRVASARTYTVKKNDTLGDVSKAVYGTSKRWRDILAANQSQIEDEDHLMVGMVLKVPG